MKYLAAPLALILAACVNPVAPSPYAGDWTLTVAATDCWPALTLPFTVATADVGPGGLVSEWAAPNGTARVIGTLDPDSGFLLRFYPAGGGYGADFAGSDLTPTRMAGTFVDPDGALTAGGSCVAEAEATH